MSRAQRLLDLIQIFRRHRHPVTAETLAAELGISMRTLYRDIGTLRAQGAHIDGEPGIGYVLKPGFMLPPMMFSEDEIEALVLGSRWVADRADGALGAAAKNALAKIGAVLPKDLKDTIGASSLLIGPGKPIVTGKVDLPALRASIRTEHKLTVRYSDEQGHTTKRTIWPFALAFFDRIRVVVAWCELRRDYRHFRVDRISHLKTSTERYPRRRAALLKEWRAREGIDED